MRVLSPKQRFFGPRREDSKDSHDSRDVSAMLAMREELKACIEEVMPPMLELTLIKERAALLEELNKIFENGVGYSGGLRRTGRRKATDESTGTEPGFRRTGRRLATDESMISIGTERGGYKYLWRNATQESSLTDPGGRKAMKRKTAMPMEPLIPPETCEHVAPPSSHQKIEFFFQSDDRRSTYSTREIFTQLSQEDVSCPDLAALAPAPRNVHCLPSRQTLHELTRGPFFEHAFGMLIILYSVFLGMETQTFAVNNSQVVQGHIWYGPCSLFFAFLFTCEILFRAYLQRARFFLQEGAMWNIFDTLALGVQIMVQLLQRMPIGPLGTSALLWLRPLRVVRLVRVVRNFESLRSITLAIGGSMMSLCWTLVILCILLYACSIVFTQVAVASLQHGAVHEDELFLWFGDLSRTSLTLLESILGGVSWDEPIRPLLEDVGPVAALLFGLYILFSIIAILNMVTGVYVDKATRMANHDKDMNFIKQISELFSQGEDPDAGITWEKFEAKLSEEHMQEYFRDIDVDPSQAFVLFQLLDVDHSGEVDTNEMVDGLIRLHGSAKALDIRMCHYELWRVHEDLKDSHKEIGATVEDILSRLKKIDKGSRIKDQSPNHDQDHSPRSPVHISISESDFDIETPGDSLERQMTPSSQCSSCVSPTVTMATEPPRGSSKLRLNLKRNAKRRARSFALAR